VPIQKSVNLFKIKVCEKSYRRHKVDILRACDWGEALLKNGSNKRDAQWTESIAVGDKEFVLETKARLSAKAVGRKISGQNGNYELRESQILFRLHPGILYFPISLICIAYPH
jgi:hypothetical protein